MFLKNFINELRAWFIVRKVYRKNKAEFEKLKIRSDWFGKLYYVKNVDPEIELGSDEDAVYLRNDLAKIWNLFVRLNIVDILAYELVPLENEIEIEEGKIEYEHGYLVTFTPAWNLERQYVTWKSVLGIIIGIGSILTLLCMIISNFIK